MIDLRLVTRFADDMARELDANSHKDGWDSMSVRRLLVRAEQELGELRRAIERTSLRCSSGMPASNQRRLPMSSESQPILSGTELKRLIEMLESKTVAFSDADVAWNDDQLDTWRLEEAQKALSAARLALEEYVERIQAQSKVEVGNERTPRCHDEGMSKPQPSKSSVLFLSRSTHSRESVK